MSLRKKVLKAASVSPKLFWCFFYPCFVSCHFVCIYISALCERMFLLTKVETLHHCVMWRDAIPFCAGCLPFLFFCFHKVPCVTSYLVITKKTNLPYLNISLPCSWTFRTILFVIILILFFFVCISSSDLCNLFWSRSHSHICLASCQYICNHCTDPDCFFCYECVPFELH